jgi:hypothetical protein
MRQIHVSKRKRGSAGQPDPPSPDLRDPDIVRAKQLARETTCPPSAEGPSDEPESQDEAA